MQAIARRQTLARLRRRIADIERQDFTALAGADALCCGPVPIVQGAVHEFRAGDYRDAPSALGLGLSLSSMAIAERRQPLVWITHAQEALHAGIVYGNGLSLYGVNLDDCIFVHARNAMAALWSAEEAVCHGCLVLLEFWTPHRLLDLTATRRLQLGAEKSGARLFLFRHRRDEGASAAYTRWHVTSAPSAKDPLDERGLGRPRWAAALEKSREGARGRWVLEWDHASRRLCEIAPHSGALVSNVVDGSFEKTPAVA